MTDLTENPIRPSRIGSFLKHGFDHAKAVGIKIDKENPIYFDFSTLLVPAFVVHDKESINELMTFILNHPEYEKVLYEVLDYLTGPDFDPYGKYDPCYAERALTIFSHLLTLSS